MCIRDSFYFALLGMAALFGGTLGMIAFQRLKPNTSPLGARRALGATSHGRTVAATVAASWTITFACLCVTYLYMRYVAGIDFGGRDGACLITTAIAALTATALGCAISAIPKVPESGKSGILTGIVCFASVSYTHLDVYKRQRQPSPRQTCVESTLRNPVASNTSALIPVHCAASTSVCDSPANIVKGRKMPMPPRTTPAMTAVTTGRSPRRIESQRTPAPNAW